MPRRKSREQLSNIDTAVTYLRVALTRLKDVQEPSVTNRISALIGELEIARSEVARA